MHLEFLVEDASGAELLKILVPQIIGAYNSPHTWKIHGYKGIGHIPKNLQDCQDPAKRMLLAQLPKLLRGFSKTPGVDRVIVVVDTDSRDCGEFLDELSGVAAACHLGSKTLFRLAIEEVEAWYLGDRQAILSAYPGAKTQVLGGYVQDSVCGTWEVLANALIPGGAASIRRAGWPLPGQVKFEWATTIGPRMDINANESPSFRKFREGLLRITAHPGM